MKADVFSFAMVMVEVNSMLISRTTFGSTCRYPNKVFTNVVPLNNSQPLAVVAKTSNEERPPRPTDPILSDDMWALMQRCWEQEPQSRPEMGVVLRDLASSLLRSLFHYTEVSPEFQAALSQFYEGSERKGCIDRLNHAELGEFTNLLDRVRKFLNLFPTATLVVTFTQVSDAKGLDEDVLQQTLYNLREVCNEQKRLPKSCMIMRQFSILTDKPPAESRYAEVWSGRSSPGEGSGGTMEVCIKVIKLEGVLQVGESSCHCIRKTYGTTSHRNFTGMLHYG